MTEPDGPVVSTPAEPRDRGICGAHTEPSGFLRAATCELLHGHAGWHHDGGMSWVDRSYDPDERERAAYERGKAEQQASLDAARQLATQLGQNADEAIAKAYARGRERGRRQATEGWGREWAVALPEERHDEGPIWHCADEDEARKAAASAFGGSVVSRLVGPWEPAEQPEPARPMRNARGLIVGNGMIREPGREVNALDGEPEPAHGGTVATQEPAVHAEEPKPPADTSWIRTTEGDDRG